MQDNIDRNSSEVQMQPSIEQLIADLQHPVWWTRRDAARELGNLGDKRAVEPLLNALTDPETQVRDIVILALGRLGDPRAVGPLLTLFPDVAHTFYVAQALSWIADQRAITALVAALRAADPLMRRSAATVFNGLNDQQAIEPLIAVLNDDDAFVRQQAAIFWRIPPEHPSVANSLHKRWLGCYTLCCDGF